MNAMKPKIQVINKLKYAEKGHEIRSQRIVLNQRLQQIQPDITLKDGKCSSLFKPV